MPSDGCSLKHWLKAYDIAVSRLRQYWITTGKIPRLGGRRAGTPPVYLRGMSASPDRSRLRTRGSASDGGI